MTTPSTDGPIRLRDLGHRVARRLPTVLIAVAVMLGLALAAADAVPKEYTATATLVVAPLVDNPSSVRASSGEINIQTEREILSSSEVARIASEAVGETLSADSALLTRRNVAAPSRSEVLQVSISDADPYRAARYANALADAYLQFRSEGAAQSAARYIVAIDDQIAELAPNADTSESLLATLRGQRQTLELFGQEPGRIIGEAMAPKNSSSPGRLMFLAAGLAAGLLLGLALALVRDRSDRRVRFAARYAELMAARPVRIRSTQDREALRWILREIDARLTPHEPGSAAPHRPRAARIALLAVGTEEHGLLTVQLQRVLQDAGRSVVRLNGTKLAGGLLDRGWPSNKDLALRERSVVLVDLSDVRSRTDVARVLEACPITLMVGHRLTRTKDLRTNLELVTGGGPDVIHAYLSGTTLRRARRVARAVAARVRRALAWAASRRSTATAEADDVVAHPDRPGGAPGLAGAVDDGTATSEDVSADSPENAYDDDGLQAAAKTRTQA